MCACTSARRPFGRIAREAMARKVGARGLRMILEELMLELMYQPARAKKRVKEI